MMQFRLALATDHATRISVRHHNWQGGNLVLRKMLYNRFGRDEQIASERIEPATRQADPNKRFRSADADFQMQLRGLERFACDAKTLLYGVISHGFRAGNPRRQWVTLR